MDSAYLVGLVPGAFLATVISGTLWVRGETQRRYFALGSGGLTIRIGADIADGYNLGHSLIGVPLLSLGSFITTIFTGIEIWLAHRTIWFWTEMHAIPPIPEDT